MKTLIILILSGNLIVFTLVKSAEAQVLVQNVNINELPDLKYIQVVTQDKGRYTAVLVDFGQPANKWNDNDNGVITGIDKKSISFNSSVHALNFLCRNGWEYVSSYAIYAGSTTQNYHLLKRIDSK